jgi:hypothetical protein
MKCHFPNHNKKWSCFCHLNVSRHSDSPVIANLNHTSRTDLSATLPCLVSSGSSPGTRCGPSWQCGQRAGGSGKRQLFQIPTNQMVHRYDLKRQVYGTDISILWALILIKAVSTDFNVIAFVWIKIWKWIFRKPNMPVGLWLKEFGLLAQTVNFLNSFQIFQAASCHESTLLQRSTTIGVPGMAIPFFDVFISSNFNSFSDQPGVAGGRGGRVWKEDYGILTIQHPAFSYQARTGRGIQGGRRWPQTAIRPFGGWPARRV